MVNHPWKFERKILAFLSGVFQVTVIGLIEFTNYILVMTSNSYKEIVLNFILLVIISQFDDFFYKTFADNEMKNILRGDSESHKNFLKVQ